MSAIATAIVGSAVVGGVVASNSADKAASAQNRSTDLSIEEQRRQFNKVQELLAPYVEAGTGSISAQQALLGLSGGDAQKEAIQGIQNSPEFAAYTQQGENAILQNASATGGLRGGNTQLALAQFRPQLLASLIQQRFGNLQQLTNVGQSSAARVGNAAQGTGNQISQLYGQQGAAQAGSYLAQGQAISNIANSIPAALAVYNASNPAVLNPNMPSPF